MMFFYGDILGFMMFLWRYTGFYDVFNGDIRGFMMFLWRSHKKFMG